MKNLAKVLILFCCCLFCVEASAQGKITVRGMVTGESDGQPLIGVSVRVVGNKGAGTATDIDGNYSISVAKGEKLKFSYVGMKDKFVQVTKDVINVKLTDSSVALDEVVKIGYGSIKKKEVTGATVQVKSDMLENTVSPDLGVAMQGLVSGLSVSASSGEPGSISNIQIRGITSMNGSNNPLFVIDGVPQEGNPNISSNEIATIDVLKDAASCAIYGTRGAAGVILITTKQGQTGKPRFTFDAVYGFQSIAYDRLPELMNTSEQTYCDILYDRNIYGIGDLESNYMLSKSPSYYMNNTDVMKMILREGSSPEQSYSLSVAGGSNGVTYNVIAGYYQQDGVVQNSDFNRFNMRSNITIKHNKSLVNANVNFQSSKTNVASGTSFGQALSFYPYTPEISRETDSFEVPGVGYSPEVSAVGSLIRSFQTRDVRNSNTIALNLGYDYEIINGLKFTSKFGTNFTNGYNEYFVPSANIFDSTGANVDKGRTSSKASNTATRRVSYTFYGGLNYNKTFNKSHKVGLTGLYSYEQYDYKGFEAGRYAVLNNDIYVINGATERAWAKSQSYYTNRLMGFIVRGQYSYKERYLLSASMRADASSKFSKAHRWGYFPSVSAGWNISEEKFWKPFKSNVNVLKLRASYGTTGNQSLSPYSYMTSLITGLDYVNASGIMKAGNAQSSFVNPDAKWETSEQFDAGVDVAFLNNKLTFGGDVYLTRKHDMLATVRMPASSGVGESTYSLVTRNIGNMENKGIELNLGYKTKFNDVWFNGSVNFSKNINKVTNLGNNSKIYNANSYVISGDPNNTSTVFAEGYEAGAFFLYKALGVANTAEKLAEYQKIVPEAKMGDMMYADANNDKKISIDDRVYCGSGMPDFEMGLNLNFEYKGFVLSSQWFASVGGDIINGPEAMSFGKGRNKLLLYQWSEANPNSNIPMRRNDGKSHMNYVANSDLWLEDGSYIRMKTLSLGYNLPKSVLSTLKCDKIYVYVTGQNLLTLTKYTGMDPEIGGDGLVTRGIDRGAYPVGKKYMFGIKIGF